MSSYLYLAQWNSLMFQDSASPIMTQLIFFHDHAFLVLILVISIVLYWLIQISWSKFTNRFFLEDQKVESAWTVIPMFILLFITFPSLRLLYLLDEVTNPGLTLKVTGNQWFWSYNYSDFPSLVFNSYMIPAMKSVLGLPRLLEVDNRITLPLGIQIRLLVTASDVIHSWAIPVLGVKVDAIPGRLNQTNFKLDRPGLFYGQCSEICGANHSFMPIVLESTSPSHFLKMVKY